MLRPSDFLCKQVLNCRANSQLLQSLIDKTLHQLLSYFLQLASGCLVRNASDIKMVMGSTPRPSKSKNVSCKSPVFKLEPPIFSRFRMFRYRTEARDSKPWPRTGSPPSSATTATGPTWLTSPAASSGGHRAPGCTGTSGTTRTSSTRSSSARRKVGERSRWELSFYLNLIV